MFFNTVVYGNLFINLHPFTDKVDDTAPIGTLAVSRRSRVRTGSVPATARLTETLAVICERYLYRHSFVGRWTHLGEKEVEQIVIKS